MSTSALLTLAEGREFLAPFIDSGGSCDNVVIDARIREAGERLYPKVDQKMSIRRLRVQVRNEHFCLPMGVLRAIAATIDGKPAPIMGPAYEFMSTGPGDLEIRGSPSSTGVVEDIGMFPTQFDIPGYTQFATTAPASSSVFEDNLYLVAFSKNQDDSGSFVTVRGYGARGETLGPQGIQVPINQWTFGTEGLIVAPQNLKKSAITVRQIEQLYKPATNEHVTLYAYSPVPFGPSATGTGELWFLTKMEPRTTTPSYRRYRFTNATMPVVNADHTITRCGIEASILVKMDHVAPIYADDILPIQNLSAYKLMIQGLKAENDGNTRLAEDLEAKATRALLEKKADEDGVSASTTFIDMGSSEDRLMPYYGLV